ncbi:MAG: elongation factor P [Candidatus Paceibacterota bacterium]|jgi:elongation factor P
MSKLDYNEIKERKYIIYDGAPYEVMSSKIGSKGGYKAVNVAKLKNMITGKVVEISFHQSERVEEADIEYKDAKFIYKDNKGMYWFSDPKNPADRFQLIEDVIGTPAKFMKANSIVGTMIFEDKIIGVSIPIKVDLLVKEAPPAVKGDTSSGATKQIVLETGATINAPLFIVEGELVSVNTVDGQYVGRGGK